jgi:hypothetical protein
VGEKGGVKGFVGDDKSSGCPTPDKRARFEGE